ncbi:unnamed protein product, partial [Urochloa humidicola]
SESDELFFLQGFLGIERVELLLQAHPPHVDR